jgi:hypothetical protein
MELQTRMRVLAAKVDLAGWDFEVAMDEMN